MLRDKGVGSKKKLDDGRTLEIVAFHVGENLGHTVIKITGDKNA